MLKLVLKIVIVFFVISKALVAQNATSEGLKMNFPAIYFKTKSTDYNSMPYTTDSCFEYMAAHYNYITSFVIWRDSNETNQLTAKRIKKLKTDLSKYPQLATITIHNMGKAQKVSRNTISQTDSVQAQYLISFNSVFDINETDVPVKISNKKSHIEHPRFWCFNCWRNHRFSKDYRRLHVK